MVFLVIAGTLRVSNTHARVPETENNPNPFDKGLTSIASTDIRLRGYWNNVGGRQGF